MICDTTLFWSLFMLIFYLWERSCSVVECLTRDRGAASSSRTGVTTLFPWARHINPCLVLVRHRNTSPDITEIFWLGRKESKQTNKTNNKAKFYIVLNTYTCLKNVLMNDAKYTQYRIVAKTFFLLGIFKFHRCPHLVLPSNTNETCIVPCMFKRDIFAYLSSEKTLSGTFPEIACFILTPDMLQKRRLWPRRIAYLHVTQVQPAD